MLKTKQDLLHQVELELLLDTPNTPIQTLTEHDKQIKKLLSSIKSIHALFIHSEEHSEWAQGAAFQWSEALTSLTPNVIASSSSILIKGTNEDILQTLTHFHNTYQEQPADRTFIVTPGWWESQSVLTANTQGILPYKQLFCVPGIPSPLLTSVIGQPQEEYLLGGVYSMLMPSQHYVNSIIGIRPQAKKVCIVFNPDTTDPILRMNLKVQVQELTTAFGEKNIEVVLHHWSSKNIFAQKLRSIAYTVDGIITLHEPAAAAHKTTLIRLCNAWNVFICASELDSVASGATLGCGVYGATFGIPLAQLMFEYLFEPVQKLEHSMGWMLHRIPQQSAMRFNESVFETAGLVVSADRLELLRMKSAFDSNCIEL